MSEKFNLTWNDFHSNISTSFKSLREDTILFDVALISSDNKTVPAHKVVLSACSEFFKTIFSTNVSTNMCLYLDCATSKEIGLVLDYIYQGEVNLYQEQLDSFLESSEKLEIEGLLSGKQEETNKEIWHSEENMQKKENSPYHEDNSLVTMNSFAPVKTRRPITKAHDDIRIDATSMTPDEVKVEIEKLYNKTDGVWICLTCGYTDVKRFNLKRHVELHIDGLSYKCNFCPKEFRSKNLLDKHRIECFDPFPKV